MSRAPILLRDFDWREARWLTVASLGFAAIFAYPMLCQLGELGPGLWGWINLPPDFAHLARFPVNGDWDMFTLLRWVPYYTVAHFHQLPFWNPYKCGGMGMLGNPESAIISPFFLPYLIFGPYVGLYLEIFLHLAIAFAGGYTLARVMGLTRVAAVVCAAAFPASSWLYLHLSVGHLNFLPAAYLPWVNALFILAVERKSMLIAAMGGLVCALTFTEGNYTFLYAGIIVAILAVFFSISKFSPRPFLIGTTLGIFAIAFAAMKIIPAWEMLAVNPRPTFGPEYDDFRMMMVYIFSRNQDLYRVGASVFLFAEYGAYLSPAFAALAIAGVAGARLKAIPWLAGAVVFFLLAEGDSGPHSALMALRHLPMSHQIDLPARFIIGFSFCVGVLAALGADFLCRTRWRWGLSVAMVLAAIGLVDSWMVGPPNLRYLFHNPVVSMTPVPEFRQYFVPNPDNQTQIALANMGSVNCQGYGYCSVLSTARGVNDIGYRAEYYLLGKGSVAQIRWTPNLLTYDIDVPAPTVLVINQNYYPGWRIAEGEGSFTTEGTLLGIAIPAGHQRVTLMYRPRFLMLAFSITLIAAVAAVVLWLKESRL
ncbi:MAG: hypothetical protein ACLQAT_26515 [Candidatus Binataceae bacterium]